MNELRNKKACACFVSPTDSEDATPTTQLCRRSIFPLGPNPRLTIVTWLSQVIQHVCVVINVRHDGDNLPVKYYQHTDTLRNQTKADQSKLRNFVESLTLQKTLKSPCVPNHESKGTEDTCQGFSRSRLRVTWQGWGHVTIISLGAVIIFFIFAHVLSSQK